MKPAKTSRELRRRRRRRIAAAVDEGADPGAVAASFSVSTTTVLRACEEFGVTAKGSRWQGATALRLIAAVQAGDRSAAQIARDHGVSQQYVRRVIQQGKKAGIRFLPYLQAPPATPLARRESAGGPDFAVKGELAENVRHHAGLIAIRAAALPAEHDLAADAEAEIWRLLARCGLIALTDSANSERRPIHLKIGRHREMAPGETDGQSRGTIHADTDLQRRRNHPDWRTDSHSDQKGQARAGDDRD